VQVTILFNGEPRPSHTIEELGYAIAEFELVAMFELWLNVKDGPALCMLRHDTNAWLMYLRHEGDSGYFSIGELQRLGNESYRFNNGQVDECPLARCIPLEECFKAIAYFFVNNGMRPDWVSWAEC
jgi:hypothetical protein